jgi:hypothetical protein
MSKTAQVHSSTQKFTELKDIIGNTVILENGTACGIIEITASNFSLLSRAEQDAKIYSYASLLNSLTFPVQILVRNKRMDISNYTKALEEQASKTTNALLSKQIELYKDFVQEMTKVNVVLSKQFYMVIPFSSLELGATAATQSVTKKGGTPDLFAAKAQEAILAKAESLLGQLRKLSSSAKLLEKDELAKLFYEIYNDSTYSMSEVDTSVHGAFVREGGEA